MELWEGAVLIVGGVWLVGYMSRRNLTTGNPAVGAPVTSINKAGLSNSSNLTDITNTAGGDPTTWGEPLEPPQTQILTGKVCPAWGCNGPAKVIPSPVAVAAPVPVPVRGVPARPVGGGIPSYAGIPVKGTIARPMDVHLL